MEWTTLHQGSDNQDKGHGLHVLQIQALQQHVHRVAQRRGQGHDEDHREAHAHGGVHLLGHAHDNCVILARAESFASKNKPLAAAVDGICQGLGYTVVLLVMSGIREVLGAGTFNGAEVGDEDVGEGEDDGHRRAHADAVGNGGGDGQGGAHAQQLDQHRVLGDKAFL